jgi:hypothetical protein
MINNSTSNVDTTVGKYKILPTEEIGRNKYNRRVASNFLETLRTGEITRQKTQSLNVFSSDKTYFILDIPSQKNTPEINYLHDLDRAKKLDLLRQCLVYLEKLCYLDKDALIEATENLKDINIYHQECASYEQRRIPEATRVVVGEIVKTEEYKTPTFIF